MYAILDHSGEPAPISVIMIARWWWLLRNGAVPCRLHSRCGKKSRQPTTNFGQGGGPLLLIHRVGKPQMVKSFITWPWARYGELLSLEIVESWVGVLATLWLTVDPAWVYSCHKVVLLQRAVIGTRYLVNITTDEQRVSLHIGGARDVTRNAYTNLMSADAA